MSSYSILITGLITLFAVFLLIRNLKLKKQLTIENNRLENSTEELEKNQKLFSDVLDAIPEMVWLKDGDGNYLMCNRALANLANSDPANIIGGTDYDIFTKDKADSYREHDLKAIASGKTTINEESADYEHEGYSIWIETSKTPMYDKHGDLIGVLGIGRDIVTTKVAIRESRENQQFLNLVMDRSPVPMLICSPNGTALRANNAFYKILNLTVGQAIGKYNLLRDENLKSEGIDEKIKQVLYQKQPVNFELLWRPELVKGVGSAVKNLIYLDVSIFPLLNNKEEITHIVAQAVDITERKQTVKNLRESEERYRAVAEDMPVLICRFLPGGEITYVNDAYCSYFNKRAEDLLGVSFLSLIPDDEHDAVKKNLKSLTIDSPTLVMEHKVYGKDGEIRWQRWTDRALFGTGNKIVAYQSIGEDITERKAADADRERLMLAIGQAAEVIMITGIEGAIEYVNPAFENITGYTREEVIGKNPRILKSNEHDEEFYHQMWSKLTKGEVWSGRFVNKNKNGSLFTEEAIISPVLDEKGSIVNYVAVKRDITNELVLESQLRQSQKMEAVGRLAGGVAHDFNNMLGVILGHVDMILDQIDPAQSFYSDLDEIQKAAMRSADLTRQLLAYARKQTVMPKVINLNRTVVGMTRMLQRLIGEDIELIWLPGEKLWPVRIDPGQIDQILANLCVNGRDAIENVGKVTVETSNTVLDEEYCENSPGFVPGEYVMLAVSDDGCGIEPETLDNVFEPFFTTKDSGEGTGLGLATVYGAVKQNNGFINVYSEPEQGTTFRIYLPRYVAEGDPLPERKKSIITGGKCETILLVEDEPAILKLVSRMLRKNGYKVLSAGTPDKAINLARATDRDIDLLMTDVIMPGMNGRDLAEEIKKIYPDLKCLFMSGYTANVIAHHGVLDEGVNFMQKPFSAVELSIKIREALEED